MSWRIFLWAALPAAAIAADCAALKQLALPHTSITVAEAFAGGVLNPTGKNEIKNLPPLCRVAGVIRPSADSDIRFEVWMPATGWKQKFQGVGNGGFAGAISYGGLADAVRHGYAAASTDTGHEAGGTDARWALNHPEKIVDFGWRAIHEMTVQAKAIIKAYYGSPPRRSYFSSCSNGGRQALMEAQRFPDDYDGIIAGAPANYFTALLTNAALLLKATAGSPDAYIPATKLPAIQAAALAACDAEDGVKDGIIQNPDRCRFDGAGLACAGADSPSCLTAPQVKALQTIYGGTRDASGRPIAPGYAPCGQAEPGGWGPWITGVEPEKSALHAFATNFFKYMVFNDPAWDYRKFVPDKQAMAAVARLARILDAANPDLRAFQRRGGKLILYHGWCDAAIPARQAIDYYESVRKRMGAAVTDRFVRFYLAPGMLHCGGGAGPNSFGQGGVAKGAPDRDIAAALERWVEEGAAPAAIIATRAERSRPLCPYPQVLRYKGAGSTDDAGSFECVSR